MVGFGLRGGNEEAEATDYEVTISNTVIMMDLWFILELIYYAREMTEVGAGGGGDLENACNLI